MRILGVVSVILFYFGLRIFLSKPKKYDLSKFDILRDNVEKIRDIYYDEHNNVKRHYDGKSFYYNVKNFPEIQRMIDTIPGVDTKTAKIYVMDFPMTFVPKLKKRRGWLRYEIVLRGGRGCVLATNNKRKTIEDGHDTIYDPMMSHKYIKRTILTRLSLIIDVSDKQLCRIPYHR
jgi:hypothetical protein